MQKEISLDLVNGNAVVSRIIVRCWWDQAQASIEILNGHEAGRTFTRPDFFAALAALRACLADSGLKPVCRGACLYVYPSGMSRDMGGGLSAYWLETARPASRDDLVNIFDPLA